MTYNMELLKLRKGHYSRSFRRKTGDMHNPHATMTYLAGSAHPQPHMRPTAP